MTIFNKGVEMSSFDDLWQNVKNFISSLPNNGKNTYQKLNIFLKSVKACPSSGLDVYIIVPNMIVKQYLEHIEYKNAITTAFNECSGMQRNVIICLSKDFNLSMLSKKTTSTIQSKKTSINNSETELQVSSSKDYKTTSSDFHQEVKPKSKLYTFENESQGFKDTIPSISSIDIPLDLSSADYSSSSPKELNTNIELENSVSNIASREKSKLGSSSKSEELKNNIFYRHNKNVEEKRFRFDNFVEGPTNENLCRCGKMVAENPGNPERNPLFVYGDAGLGKTHILHAIGNEIASSRKNLTCMYINIDDFIQDYMKALNSYYNSGPKELEDFRSLYKNLDVLLIDDVQELDSSKKNYDNVIGELKNLIERTTSSNQQFVFASNVHPQNMNVVDNKLKGRFIAGVCIKVEPPDAETREKIICKKAEEMSLKLDKGCIQFITQKFATNVRVLEGIIKTIKAQTDKNQTITIGMVKEILKDALEGKEKLLTIDNIKKQVADYYKLTVKEIDSTARPKPIVDARQMAMFLARQLTNNSYPSLGKEFGGKDHSTVINACKKIKKLIDTKQQYKNDYDNLYSLLN